MPLFAPLLLPLALAADPPTSYTIDASKSKLYVQVFKDTSTAGSDLSHDHVVLATGWRGTVKLSATDPAACAADVVVPVSGLTPDLPELRQRVGYTVMLTESQRAQVAEHMLGADQLDAAGFPEIRFAATSCSGAVAAAASSGGSAATRTVTGNLTIHGVAKSVQIPLKVSFEAGGGGVHINGAFSAVHEDFGLVPFTALFGALKNQDTMRFTLDVVGVAAH